MNEKEYLLSIIKKVRRRINTGILLRRTLEGLCLGLFAGALVEAYAHFRPFYYAHVFSIAAVILGGGLGILFGCLQRKDMHAAAGKVDSFGLKERVVTAYESIDAQDTVSVLQRRDAVYGLSIVEPKIHVPLLVSSGGAAAAAGSDAGIVFPAQRGQGICQRKA